jgi:uncharacterized protein
VTRAVIWTKQDPFGVEFADIALESDHLSAAGVAIGSAPVPYRLDYELETTAGFITTRLRVAATGQGWRRELDLRRDDAGSWTASATMKGELDLPPPGGSVAGLDRALDCDLGLSPLTNSMPILRHQLQLGGELRDFQMAWVSVPDLGVRISPQRYAFVRKDARLAIVRYQARDSDFTADLTVDAQGIVVDYPGIGRLISS